MGSRRERVARPEFGPSDGRFKISGNSPGGPSPATRVRRPELSAHATARARRFAQRLKPSHYLQPLSDPLDALEDEVELLLGVGGHVAVA